jgi:flavorubredoxin
MKIMVIYDSQTGNTEKMAKAVAEGASSVVGAVVEVKKIGEAFPLSMLEKADGLIIGSPCVYANVTDDMRSFLSNVNDAVKAGKVNVKGHNAAIFGSYGWDGAWIMETKLKGTMQSFGYKVYDAVCVLQSTNIKYHADTYMEECKEFGANFVKSLK